MNFTTRDAQRVVPVHGGAGGQAVEPAWAHVFRDEVLV